MGNELKLSLENFQSISSGELVFQVGTNVIIGQSNSGKTATFRALKACLSNPAGSQRFIKKGTTHSVVTLEYNGNCITWRRTPKESSYTINGEDYIKTGKSDAFKLVENTGFVIDSSGTIMNIEEELQLPFPFGVSKSDLFRLYENVFCISDSAVILKAAKDKEEEVKSDISNIENEILKSKTKLEEIAKFRSEVNLKLLEEKKDYFKKKSDRILFLKDGIDLIHKVATLETFDIQEVSFEDKVKILKENLFLKKELNILKNLHIIGKSLKEGYCPSSEMLTVLYELKELQKVRDLLSTVIEVPIKEFESKLQKYQELQDSMSFLKALKAQIKLKKIKLEEIEKIIQEKEKGLQEFKVCPLCHRPF